MQPSDLRQGRSLSCHDMRAAARAKPRCPLTRPEDGPTTVTAQTKSKELKRRERAPFFNFGEKMDVTTATTPCQKMTTTGPRVFTGPDTPVSFLQAIIPDETSGEGRCSLIHKPCRSVLFIDTLTQKRTHPSPTIVEVESTGDPLKPWRWNEPSQSLSSQRDQHSDNPTELDGACEIRESYANSGIFPLASKFSSSTTTEKTEADRFFLLDRSSRYMWAI